MNYIEREEKLRQIVSGFFHFKFKGKMYRYIEPSNMLYSEIAFYTEGLEDELKKTGFLTKDDEKNILIEKGLWSEEKEKELKLLQDKYEELVRDKPKYKFQSKTLKAIEIAAENIFKKLEDMNETRNSMYLHTIEYQKFYRTNILMLSQCVKDFKGNQVWSSVEDLENSIGVGETDVLLKIINSSARPSTKTIRELARNEPWRTIWKTSVKTGSPLFRHPTSEMTKHQYELCYWSNIYDAVYESSDFPGQDVIDDDNALDEWFVLQSNKNKEKNKGSSQISKNQKIANASEVFVAVDTPEDAQKVYDELNTKSAKAIMDRRAQALEKHEVLAEDQLPDVSEGLRIAINQAGMKKI